jgi:hypothetical protein
MMKKLIVLVTATMFCIACMAAVPSNSGTNAGDERVNCKKISVGIKKARITLSNGEKKILPLDQLESYVVNGLVFDKKELYKYGKPTGETAFMQLLQKRGNLSFYKNLEYDPEIAREDRRHDVFYVYNGEELYMTVDKKALPNICNFFKLKLSYR